MYVKHQRPLDPWLTLAALVPFNETLPPFERASKELIGDVMARWESAAPSSPEIQRGVSAWSIPHIAIAKPEWRYELLLKVRDCIAALLAAVNRPAIEEDGILIDQKLLSLSGPSGSNSNRRGAVLTRDGVVFEWDDWMEFLSCIDRTGKEIWNLRRCPVCDAPFLLRREDQTACSLNCANTFRLRQYRLRRSSSKSTEKTKKSMHRPAPPVKKPGGGRKRRRRAITAPLARTFARNWTKGDRR